MFQSTFDALQRFFGMTWALFTSWYIPGTQVTPAVVFLLFMAVSLMILIVRRFFIKS